VGTQKEKPKESQILARKLGAAIRRFRIEAGLSQDELAWRSEVHRAYLGVIERGEQNITVKKLAQVCHGLGIKPSSLLAKIGH
jgi:transcriptional regulator with XRE-family HTH domain